jgi:hypothetical protein
VQSRPLRCEALEDRRLLTLGSISGTVFDDFNADGVQDAAEVGLSGWNVVLERTDTPEVLLTVPNPDPNEADDDFAFSVATLGNNVIVGAPNEDVDGMTDVGRAYLIDGMTGGILLQIDHPDPVAVDHFGCSVASVGKNILVGTRRDVSNPDHVADTGVAYLFDGLTGNLIQTLYDPNPDSDPQPGTNDWFSGVRPSVASFGDNVLIGAPLDDTTGAEVGIVYLFSHEDGSEI